MSQTQILNKIRPQNQVSGQNCSIEMQSILTKTTATPIICERSLKILLENILLRFPSTKKIVFTDQCGGSDERIANSTQIINQIQNVNEFLGIKVEREIYGIIDDCLLDNIWKEKLGKNLLVLKSTELELIYPFVLVNRFLSQQNLPLWQISQNPSFSKNYLKEKIKLKTIKQLHPNIKVELAEFVSQNVEPDFIKKLTDGLYELLY
jgi:hypothetical protein